MAASSASASLNYLEVHSVYTCTHSPGPGACARESIEVPKCRAFDESESLDVGLERPVLLLAAAA